MAEAGVMERDEATGMGAAAPKPVEISGSAAAAILLLLLEDDEAGEILKHFDPDEIKKIGAAMYAASKASDGEIESALGHFVNTSRDVSELSVHADPHIRSVVTAAVGNVRADNLLAEIAPTSSEKTLDILRWMEIPVIGEILAEEHPQVGAIILAVLKPEIAAAVLDILDENLQSDLVCRAARLETVSAQAIADLEDILTGRADIGKSVPKMRMGGSNDVAKIIGHMKRPKSQQLLKSVKKQDKELAARLEEEMVLFDDLIELDAKDLAAVMREVEGDILALALRGATDEMSERIFASMSQRAAQTVQDDIEERGPVPKADVDAAQKAIVNIARRLAEEGTIIMGGGDDDYV